MTVQDTVYFKLKLIEEELRDFHVLTMVHNMKVENENQWEFFNKYKTSNHRPGVWNAAMDYSSGVWVTITRNLPSGGECPKGLYLLLEDDWLGTRWQETFTGDVRVTNTNASISCHCRLVFTPDVETCELLIRGSECHWRSSSSRMLTIRRVTSGMREERESQILLTFSELLWSDYLLSSSIMKLRLGHLFWRINDDDFQFFKQ